MITHNEEIARMADRVIYIKDGKLIQRIYNEGKLYTNVI